MSRKYTSERDREVPRLCLGFGPLSAVRRTRKPLGLIWMVVDRPKVPAASEASPPLMLRTLADIQRVEREKAEAARAAEANAAAEAARQRRLSTLGRNLDGAWLKLETLVEASSYDEAVKLAVDLRDLATRDGATPAFATRFEAMRKRQLRRRGFFDRWKRVEVVR